MSKIVFIPGFVATVTTIVIDNTPIIGGASGRILFENAANQISESANFSYLAGIFNVTKTATHQAQFTFDTNNYFRIKATSTGATELSAAGTAPKFLFNADVDAQTSNVYANKVGVGTITPAAILQVLGTTQQARFSYNATNYLGLTIASNGSATYALTGITPINIFTNNLNVAAGAPVTLGVNDATKYAYGATRAGDFNLLFGNNNNAFVAHYITGSQYIIKTGVSTQSQIEFLTGDGIRFGNTNTRFSFQKWSSLSNGVLGIYLSEGFSNDYTYTAIGTASGTQSTQLVIKAQHTSNITNILDLRNFSNVLTFSALANGDIGIGAGATVSARLHIISSTEQVRIGYNASNYVSYTVGSTGSLTIGLTGTTPRTTFSQGINVLGTIKLNGYTVATLPAGVIGETAYVTDALAPIFLGIIAGGGAVVTPVFYNGANWIAQ
jgi:hypothetical protein